MSFYVTTPIYYVNAAPHLGHAYSTIAADVMARHMRQRGEDVFFLTGTDEHGEPVALAAEREGVTPQELVDRNAPRFIDLMPRLNVSNDFFIRTSDPEHMARVQEILSRIRDNGHVYEGVYEGWYCPRCADFKTDAEAGEDNLCPIHKTPLTREKEDNYFFRLSAFQDDLLKLLDEQPDFVMPRHRYNEARSFIESGLQDVSLSRSTFTWGVPVPWDEKHVFYVWFDALLNYYTALSYAKRRRGPHRALLAGAVSPHRQGHPEVPHGLLAGDAAWPPGCRCPSTSSSTASCSSARTRWASRRATRSTRSRSWTSTAPTRCASTSCARSPSATTARSRWRASARATSPSSPTTSATSPAARSRWSTATATASCPTRRSTPTLAAEIDGLSGEVCALLDRADLSGAADAIWLRVRRLNRYVEEQAPWTLAKDPERAGELDSVLASLAEALRVVAVVLHPWIPESSDKLLAALGAPRARARRRAHAGRPARRDRQARPAVPEALDRPRRRGSDRQPHPPARLQARRRRARRGGGRRRGAADAHRRHERRDLPRGAAGRRALPAGASPRSAAIPTRRPASTTPTSPSCGRSPSTRAASRSARPAWTTTATTRRAPTSSARSPRRSSSPARPASRSSSTRAPPRTRRSTRCASTPAGST